MWCKFYLQLLIFELLIFSCSCTKAQGLKQGYDATTLTTLKELGPQGYMADSVTKDTFEDKVPL